MFSNVYRIEDDNVWSTMMVEHTHTHTRIRVMQSKRGPWFL